jgi:hypothetical protein
VTSLRAEIAQCRADGLAGRPELRWHAFQYAVLLLLLEARENARVAQYRGAAKNALGPEASADELLDQIRLAGARIEVDPRGLVAVVLDEVQRALHEYIAVPARWGSWAALQGAVQQAAEGVAVEVAAIVEDMVGARDSYRRTTKDEDAADTVLSMNRVIDMMRLAVAAVHVPAWARG